MSKSKTLIKDLGDYKELHRDPRTGIAWVEDGSTGMGHSAHPNISSSGSVRGMKSLGYWRTNDVTIRSHGFIYNVSRSVVSDDLDKVAAANCRCPGSHPAEELV